MRRHSALLFVVAVLAGCGEPETEPRERDPRDVFVAELAALVCESSAACCSNRSLREPSEICEASQRNDATIQLINAERDGRSVDLAQSDACLTRYRVEWSCDAMRLAEDLATTCPELFSAPVEGGAAPGEPCSTNADCSSPGTGDRACRKENDTDDGTCAWYLPTQFGDPCTDTEPGVFHVCAEGSTCVPPLGEPTGARTCGPLGALGDQCFDRFGCESGYACALDGESVLRCQEPISDGGNCAQRIDACRPQAFCDTVSDTCKVLPIFDECSGGTCEPYEFDKVCR